MNQIKSHIPTDVQNDISQLFNKTKLNKEFEFIFFSKNRSELNKKKYVLLLKYFKALSKKYELVKETTLDVNFNGENNKTNRITIFNRDEIDKSLKNISEIQNKNYVIYNFLLQQIIRNTKNNKSYQFLVKEKIDNIDNDDLNLRIRLSQEDDLTADIKNKNVTKLDKYIGKILNSKLDLESKNYIDTHIKYRLKERTSIFLVNNDDYFVRIDLTDTKTSSQRNHILTIPSNYELEIEFGVYKDKVKPSKETLELIYTHGEQLLKVLQQSKFIIGETKRQEIIEYYKEISGIKKNITKLAGRKAISLEIQHLSEILPNKYAVTDKADGDRYFLIIYKNNVYLISFSNLIVKDTGIVLDKKLEKYNGSLLDGEYIYLPKKKRHLFMAFDCLRNGGRDIRNEVSFMKRLEEADDIIAKCFIFKKQVGYEHKSPFKELNMTEFDENKVAKYYSEELKQFYDNLDNDINEGKIYPLIRRKFFMSVSGAKSWEIYKYSSEYWNKYELDSNVKIPYLLDGLIYHPLEQSYETNQAESKFSEYKWKPTNKNSIDMYIEFKRDRTNNKILRVYDNSDDDIVQDKLYQICSLYVGRATNNLEQPIPFDKNHGTSDCYIFETNGVLKDIEGNVISDKTVVEFYYQNDPNIIPQKRWIPIRTRYDKTESVEKYKKEYGNYFTVADKVWRSIINPVLMSDMIDLSKGNTNKRNYYELKMKEINNRITKDVIIASNKEKRYYQKKNKIADTMRQFHNAIKSNLIYTYANKIFNNGKSKSIFDIACGRGGDIGKFYYCNPDFYVGIDIDDQGLKSPDDGAISRYNNFRKKKPDFPRMYFIQADARAVLDLESQRKVLSGMDNRNESLIKKFFPISSDEKNIKYQKFDVINCQFAIHYFLKDKTSWKNFKTNIKNHLKNGGYLLATCFDAHQVIKAIGQNNNYDVHYTDSEGTNKLFFDVVKKYDDVNVDLKKPIKEGNAIDLYTSWMFNEGNYFTEYLVDYNYIVDSLNKECGLELVDSDLFQNQFNILKRFFNDSFEYESKPDTMKYFQKVQKYFDETDINEKCYKYTNLHRYYVFRMKDKTEMKGGDIINDDDDDIDDTEYNLSNTKQFKKLSMKKNYDNEYSFMNSIHRVLTSHKMIPKTISVQEFVEDMGFEYTKDINIDDKFMKTFGKKVIIKHEVDTKNKIIMNGLNFYLVEPDCNSHYDIESISCGKKNSRLKNMILMKEETGFVPIMKINKEGKKGLFAMDDDLLTYLDDNSD
jgi:SAM-dependent methyltransferase